MAEKRRDNKGRVLRLGESQRKDGSYMYRFTDSNKKRQTIYAPSLAELRKKEDEITLQQLTGKKYDENKLTVAELIDMYYEQKEKSQIRQGSLTQYSYTIKRIKKDYLSKMIASTVKTTDAKEYVLRLEEAGSAYATIKSTYQLLRVSFDILCEDEVIFRNPFEFKLSQVISDRPNAKTGLTPTQQKSLLDFVKSTPRFTPYLNEIVILMGTGLRIGEFCALTDEDIDFHKGAIRVNKQLLSRHDCRVNIGPPKSKAGFRYIPMSEEVADALRDTIRRREIPLVEPVVDGVSGFIFLSNRETVKKPILYNRLFTTLERHYNKSHKSPIIISPHILRHTFCTNMVRAGVDPKSVQYIMGHSSAELTMDIYTHYTFEDAMRGFQKAMGAEKEVSA